MHFSELLRAAFRPAILDVVEVSDAELLKRFRDAHDPVAFEVLVHRHGPMVWGACRRIIGNHHAAEDAFQATFLALAQRSSRIRHSVAAWLHRVAVHAGLDVLRRRRLSELPAQDWEPMDHRPGPVECAMAAELLKQIDAAINRLPTRLGHALVLCDLHGYSLKEAAAQLACPVGTVESRLARARKRLRGLLSGYQPAVGGALAVVAVPGALRAATVRSAFDCGAVRPAIAALAARAAVGAGWGAWGLAAPGLATVITAAVLFAAVAFGQPDASQPSATGSREAGPCVKASSARSGGGRIAAGAIVRLGSSRFRHDATSMSEIAFSPDSKQVAAGDNLGVSVFEAQTGKLLYRFPCAQGQMARVVRFVANGKQLAIGSADWQRTAQVTLMDLANGKQIGAATFTGKNQIFVIDVTNDGKRALVEDRFHKVFLWDIDDAKELWQFEHPEAAFTMPLTADGKSFVVAMSRKAELRDARTGKVVADFPSPGAKFESYSAAIAPNGKLAIASQDGQAIAILDARGTKPVQKFKADGRVSQLLFSPDGQYLVGLAPLETLVWDTLAKAGSGPIARLPGAAHGGFSKDSKTLALDDVGFISLWQVDTWKLMAQSADPPSPVHSVRFSADGKHVLGYSRQGWLRWPVNGGPATRISDDSRVFFTENGTSQVSDDGRVAADILYEPGVGHGKRKYYMRITDLATGKARRINVDRAVSSPVAVSPDGRFVSASLESSEFVVWDSTTGNVVLRQKQTTFNDRFLLGATLSQDGKSVARSVTVVFTGRDRDEAGTLYNAVYVTDHARKREFTPSPMPWSIYSGGVQFSDDGSKVIIHGHFDGDWRNDTVAVWDVRSGRRLVFWTRPEGRLDSVRLSRDGRSMTIGDGAGRLAIIEIASGKERATLRHGGMILSAAFHSDGTKVVASSPEAPVYVWDLLGAARKWDANKAEAIWADLASADATIAFAAMQTLRANPADGIALLKDRVKLPTVPPQAKIGTWLKQLDSSEFAERDEAQRELVGVAELIQPHLEAARKGVSLEVLRRLDLLRLSATDVTPERLRHVRACEVLEGIGTSQAARVLETFAAGPAGARLTSEASDSVARLARH